MTKVDELIGRLKAPEDWAIERSEAELKREAATALTDLQAQVAGLREHISEQATHVETRIKDGIEIGASVWRIALEDVARENRQALEKSNG